jgi:hypothetical protein
MDIPARRELPPPNPIAEYIFSPNNGKAKPKRARSVHDAASAEAAYVNESTR